MASIGNYGQVLKYKLAVASLRKRDEPLKLAHTVRHLGDAYYCAGRAALAEHGDLQRSREWLSEAIAAADANDPETMQYIREVSAQIELEP